MTETKKAAKRIVKKKATTKRKIVDDGKPPRKKKQGRPAREFTDEEREYIITMVASGIDQDTIAAIIGCSISTLHKHCKRELDHGKSIAHAQVARALMTNATQLNNFNAQRFFLGARCGWVDGEQQVDGPQGSLTINLYPTEGKPVVYRKTAPQAAE